MEQIYTIPVNEAFDLIKEDSTCGCPLCALYKKLEDNEIERILGAAMMEPDVRIRTNQEGFCSNHFDKMLTKKNRLSLALMLESHLATVEEMLQDSIIGVPGEKSVKKIQELNKTCYVCNRIQESLGHMFETVIYLWKTDPTFQAKYKMQNRFCLDHYKSLLELARYKMPKKVYVQFYRETSQILKNYLTKLQGDVSWFCKKFDYRYEEEPWYDAKDSIERTIAFLTARDAKEGRKK